MIIELKRVISVFILSILSVLLAACSSPYMQEAIRNTDQLKTGIAEVRQRATPIAQYIDAPTYHAEEIPIEKPLAPWLAKQRDVRSNGLPFYYVAEDLLRESGISPEYDHSVDINRPLHLVHTGGTVQSALQALEAASGFHYSINNKKMLWSYYQTRHFDVSHVGGDYSYSIDGASTQGGSDGIGNGQQGLHKTNTSDSNALKELQGSIKTIIGDIGDVNFSRTANAIIVTTSKSRMRQVSQYMAQINAAMAKQVEFEIKILRFSSNNLSTTGVDWTLVNKSLGFDLNLSGGFASAIPSGLLGANSSQLSVATQSTNVSSILIKALSEQGQVSVVTEPRVQTLINRVATVAITESQNYVSATTRSVDDSGTETITAEVDTVSDGYSLSLIANTDANGRIYLHISSHIANFLGLRTTQLGTSVIEHPTVKDNRFAQTVVLNDGQTVLVNSLKKQQSKNSSASPINAKTLPFIKSGDNAYEDILVLITPKLINLAVK